jgi:hypothetical protein
MSRFIEVLTGDERDRDELDLRLPESDPLAFFHQLKQEAAPVSAGGLRRRERLEQALGKRPAGRLFEDTAERRDRRLRDEDVALGRIAVADDPSRPVEAALPGVRRGAVVSALDLLHDGLECARRGSPALGSLDRWGRGTGTQQCAATGACAT